MKGGLHMGFINPWLISKGAVVGCMSATDERIGL